MSTAETRASSQGADAEDVDGRLRRTVDEYGVCTLTLDHAASLNGMTTAVADRMRGYLEDAASDDSIRCVVLTGAGRAFCAGQDLRSADKDLGADVVLGDHYAPLVLAIASCPKPTIAALNGVAAGFGASIAIACDLRVASHDASMAFVFSRIGLAADGGASWFLPRITTPSAAAELLFFGRRVDADECRDLGLVSSVVPAAQFPERTEMLARQLADGPMRALALLKKQLAASPSNDLEAQLAYELETQREALGAPENVEGRSAFLEKRSPDFRGVARGE